MAFLGTPPLAKDAKAVKDPGAPGSTSFYIPEVFVHPPAEEDMNEPCISYAPNDMCLGMPNPHQSKPRSALNAILQAFTCLPGLNEELPAASKHPLVADFVTMMRTLHADESNHPHDQPRVAARELVEMRWWIEDARLPRDDDPVGKDLLVDDFDLAVRALLDNVFVKTRFGQRFKIGLVDAPHPDVLKKIPPTPRPPPLGDGAPTAPPGSTQRNDSAVEMPPLTTYETNHLLTISLAHYSDTDTITLVSLLNDRFGHAVATFFFGGAFKNRSLLHNFPSPRSGSHAAPGPPATTPSTTTTAPPPPPPTTTATTATPTSSSPFTCPTPHPDRQIKFSHLPHFLTIHLDRPIVTPTPPKKPIYHNPTVELPTEIDLGFYLDNRHSDQKTFYRLHGFVTQTEGHFLTYSRLRGGHRWFKCDDETVVQVNLGTRVESRGVMLVIYRLQER
ncbi:hypothetical protein PhCBS80983_g05324 [Powellomyces hirtus]|uniref:Peptidase C19 ubiquitin carboxyl-terminal hydrolase domain-containing protein n=1 Tax=Powellomyces hirtus TaxID=109895 RepID=A0A507DX16_9FUNG|nr:hypothetical protein PhCBS80983_g05324 [Powellomyces hirtus]